MMKKNDLPPEDDGRIIADMSDLDRPNGFLSALSRFPAPPKSDTPFSRQDRRAYTLAALASALAIGAVYLVGIGIVIWLITLFG